MILFDSHCHLFDEQFAGDVDQVISRAREAGVTRFVVPAIDLVTARQAVDLALGHEEIYAAVGLHPESLDKVDAQNLDWLADLANHPKVLAIGEIGLDYYWDVAPREVQQQVFRRQLQMATTLGLPVVVHNRDATEDTVRILREESNGGQLRGVMHCFTGSLETAKQCMDIGFYISFGGPVTFKNARKVQETATAIPMESLLVETDSPYLSPHPFRGQRNEPARVQVVAEKLAELQGVSPEVMARTTTANACRLFGIEQ